MKFIHGNCFNTMGAGVAKQIKQKFPKVYELDCLTSKGDAKKLGTYGFVEYNRNTSNLPVNITNNSLFVINAYTQYYYGRNKDYFDYDAFKRILQSINVEFKGLKIGMPMIGCGLAGGNKDRILDIISSSLKNMHVYVCCL